MKLEALPVRKGFEYLKKGFTWDLQGSIIKINLEKGSDDMARSSFQKLKIIYVMDYLLRYSDEQHPVSVAKLIEELERHDISAERKSIYDDIECLRTYGLDIAQSGTGRGSGYYVASRDFELPELKLLVDSVQSSKFITHRKTLSLIKKIAGLASVHEAQLLSRQVFVKNRIKTMNESIYYNVDEIHRGIAENKKIRFHYFEYTVGKEKRFRRGGDWYKLSPFALSWDDENYYMVAYDSESGRMKHFRVDKMAHIELCSEERDGQSSYEAFDMGAYSRKVFDMFSGDELTVQLRFDNSLVGAVLDRLGREVMLIPDGEDHFTVRTEVAISPRFYAWVFGFGDKARIISPPSAVEGMREHIRSVSVLYDRED